MGTLNSPDVGYDKVCIQKSNNQFPKERSRVSEFKLPIMAFTIGIPSGGLPILTDWACTAQSDWAGYEGWREGLEFKPVSAGLKGAPLSYGKVEVTKGFGRLSCLLFGLVCTYVHLKNSLTDEEMEEFKKCLGSFGG